MKKLFCVTIISLFGTACLYASNPFDKLADSLSGVTREVAQERLDNFATDLGGLMGGGTFHSGKNLGIPGFDVSARVVSKKISDDDEIVKAAGVDTAFIPVLQAEIGLPFKIDLVGRFMSYDKATLAGGGVRYGIIKNDCPGLPSLSAQVLYNALDVKSGVNRLKATTITGMVMASFNVPVVDPYIGIGMDSTSVEPDATISTLKGEASGVRVEAGVNLGLFPLTYLQLGGSLTDGTIDYTAGFGVKF